MPVEVKVDLTIEDIDDHIDRIKKIRLYMDSHNDKRTIVGAAAGAIVPDNVCRYAQKKGLYVLVQSGDSAAVAEMSKEFIRGEGLIPKNPLRGGASGALKRVLNQSPLPRENNHTPSALRRGWLIPQKW